MLPLAERDNGYWANRWFAMANALRIAEGAGHACYAGRIWDNLFAIQIDAFASFHWSFIAAARQSGAVDFMVARSTNRTSGYPGSLALGAIWVLVGVLAYARHYVLDPPSARAAGVLYELLIWLSCFVPWVVVSPLIFRLESMYPLRRGTLRQHLASLLLASIPVCYLVAQLVVAECLLLEFMFHRPLVFPKSWLLPDSGELLIQFLIYGSVVAGASVLQRLRQLREREQEAAQFALEKAELESGLRQAQLESLRARLNPHFLFNSLQNIAVLTSEDPKTATQMLSRLGDLLRVALRQGATAETPLEEEIAITKAYVAIEEMRFAGRLFVLFDVGTGTGKALVPTFFLQPLVENAILHGLNGVHGQGIISIRSRAEGERLIVTLIDNGVGVPAREPELLHEGVGLTSTLQRLEKLYPQQHSFSIAPLPEGGTQVRIEIPLRSHPPEIAETLHEQASIVDRR